MALVIAGMMCYLLFTDACGKKDNVRILFN